MKKNDLIRIAMIEPVGGHGGMDYYDLGLCEAITNAGLEVTLYTCDETTTPQKSNFIIKKWYVGIFGRRNVLLRALSFLIGTIRIFFNVLWERMPIVHYHFFDVGIMQIGMLLIPKIIGRRIVVTIHDVEGLVEGKGSRFLSKYAYKLANLIIVHNDFSKDQVMARLGVPSHQIKVVVHGNYQHIYPCPLDRNRARESLNIPDGAKVVLFFGQIKGVKRLDLLLDAFSSVVEVHPEAHLIVAGKIVDVPFVVYQKKIVEMGIGGKCTCLIRYIKNEEVPVLYSSADIVALPYDRIYQSGVLLMAMTFQRAVVASNIPGMLSIVEDNHTGYIFEAGNKESLSQKISQAFAKDEERERLAKNGLILMETKYSWSTVGQETASIYRSLYKN